MVHWFAVDIDSDDDEYEILFRGKKRRFYQCPKPNNIIWVKCTDVFCKIFEPVPIAKYARMMKVDTSDLTLVDDMYN
jgi:hypothetical protein